MCKALPGIIALPFASAVVTPYFNYCGQILQGGQCMNLSVTWIMKVLEIVSCENQVREDLGSVITALPAMQSLSVEVMFFWRVMGRNWSERSIYKQGWYSWWFRSRPKTWICFLIIYPYILFHHLPIPRISSPVSDGKYDFWIVFCLFRDIWNVILLHYHIIINTWFYL